MSFGISALTCRLDSDVPASVSGAVNWADFLAWNGGTRPAFAGKYLLGSPWRLVHGEATSLIDPLVPGAALRIAPLQASDPIRQAEGGDLGEQWGAEDGNAVAAAIEAGRRVGDLDITTSGPTYVYLEVAVGTALTPQYWAGWATAVGNAMFVGDKIVGAVVVPTIQPLLPCLATAFEAAPTAGHWQLPTAVRSALDLAKTVGWQSSRCHGFWPTTADPATITPAPALNWSSFDPYVQPQKSGPATPVPVRIWRFASGDAAAPVHQVGRLTLDATAAPVGQPDPVLEAMLIVRSWRANRPGTRPTAIGVDRGASLAREIRCLSTNRLKVSHLPEATRVGTVGPALTPPLTVPASFAARYYSAGPTSAGQPPSVNSKDLTRVESRRLASTGVDIVSTWQARVLYENVSTHLADPANGRKDGQAAGWFAAMVTRQPAHTPIYFAVDCDVTTTGTSTQSAIGEHAVTDGQLIAYFTGVAAGMDAYLAAQDKDDRVPYPIGVYGCARAFDLLYRRGLASHYWQAFPPFWGDDVIDARTNAAAWPYANIWQVGMSTNPIVQSGSGLKHCQSTFTWIFAFNDKPGPAQIRVTVGTTVTNLAFPPTVALLAAATGASVTVSNPQPGETWMTMERATEPSSLKIEIVGVPAAGTFRWGFDEVLGLADLDIAWGDTGGWRIRGGGR